MEQGKPGRRRERVAPEQAGEDECRAGERNGARRTHRQPDGEHGEQDARGDEADSGSGAFCEVRRSEGAMDAGADGAGEDDDVAPEAAHWTITSPSMSFSCSVQT